MEDSFETRLPQSYSPSSGTFNVHGSESLSLGTSTSSSSSSRGSITKNPVYRQQRYNELLAIVEAATVDPDVVVQFGDDVDGNGGGGQPATIVTYTRVQENEIAVVIEDEPHHVNDLEEANFVTGPETVGRTVDRQESLSMSASLQYPTRLRPAKDLVVQGGSEMSAVVRRDTEKPIDYNSSHVVWLTPREEIICEDRKEPRPTVEQSQPVHVTSVIAEPNAGSNSLEVKTSAKLDTERQVTVAPGLVREVRHKRHVIEEIVVEDCEKYYEELSSSSSLHKRRRVKRSTTPVVEDTVTPSPRISQLNADPSVATVRGDDIQRTGTDPTLNRLSVTYIVQHGSPHGSLRDSSPKTDEPDVTGATMRSDDQSKTVTYIVHHDAAASSRNSRSSSSNRNSSMEPQGGDISQAPRVNTATLDMPDTVTYVTHHDLLRRLTPPGFTSTGATIGTEQMSEKRLAGPSLASEAVDFDQTPLHTVTYVVNYDVPGEGSKVVKETASLSRAPHPMTSKTSAAESSRNRVVGHIEREHRGDRSVVDLSSPVEGSQSVTFVTQYEITTDKRGLTESSSSSAAGKSLSSHDRTELELHHEFMRPPAEQREEDPQPANKMFLMASKTDRDSIKYVVEYDIEDKKRKKTKSSRVYVTVQPTLECNTSEGANIQLTVGDADEKHHTRVKTVPPASRDYVTYVVEYEIMPKKRRQLAAADQKRPEVLQLEHTPAVAGPSTGIEPDVPKYEAEPLNSSRTRPNPTAVPEFSTYVVEYEIRKKMRNEQDEAEQIASTSASHTTASDATDTQRNIESALAGRQPVVVPVLANNAASVTYVVEYEITAKKPRKEQLKAAIVSVVPASGPRELGMQTASDLQTTELNPNDEEPIYNSYAASQMMSCTDSVPQSITYTVEYDLKSRKNRQTMGAPITCGTDDERAAEPIADEEIRVASSDIDFHPTVMEHVDRQYAVPVTAHSNTVTYVVEYDLSSSKKGSSKATASAKTKETNEQVYTLTSARGNEVKDLTDNVPGLVVDVQEGSQQHYQPITTQDNTMKYVVEYSVLPTNNKKTKSTHAKLATETEVKTVDVASIGELPGDPSAIDVAPPMEFREIVDSQHSDPSTKPLNNNPVTYVVQYEIASKRRNKQKGHKVTASYATDSRANYPAAIRCEVFSPTVDSEQPYETAVHVGEHNAAPVNAEVETFVNYVEYDVTRRNKKRIKTVQVVEAGGATDENTFALQPAGEALMKQSTHEVAVHSNESDIKLQQTKAPVVVETSNFTYVVEYEITSRNKRKIKSNQVTQSRKETVAEPLAITSTGQLETGAVAQHGENRANISGIVDNQPCDPAASNTVTYVVQYEILSKQNKRLKASQATKTGESKQEVSFATVAAPELKTTSPEIDVETPAECIQIDSEQLATSATPHNNTVTYVVEYSVLSKKNKKSKSTDHAKQTGETEVKAVDVASTEEHPVEPSAIDVVLPMEFQELVASQQAEPMTDSLNSNTVTYVVQYEIASKRQTKLKESQVLVPGTTGGRVSSPVAIRDDVISTMIDAEHPVEAVVSVGQQNAAPDSSAQADTVTYVVQYDVTRRNMKKTTRAKAVDSSNKTQVEAVASTSDLEAELKPSALHVNRPTEDAETVEHAAPVDTVTFIVEYDITKSRKKHMKNIPKSATTFETDLEQHASPLESDVAIQPSTIDVVVPVEIPKIICSQDTALKTGHENMVTYIVEYEMPSKKGTKPKTAIMGLSSGRTKYSLESSPVGKQFVESLTVDDEPNIETPQVASHLLSKPVEFPDSITFVVDYKISPKLKRKLDSPAVIITGTSEDGLQDQQDNTNRGAVEEVIPPTFVAQESVTYQIEYEMTSKKSKKVKTAFVTAETPESKIDDSHMAVATDERSIRAVIGAPSADLAKTELGSVVDIQSRRSNPTNPAKSDRDTITFTVDYDILAKKAGKWVLPAPTTTIISSQGAKDETILKSLEFDHVSVEASTRTYVVESSDVTVPVEVIVDDSVLDGSFEWERRGCVEEPEVVVEVTPTAAASSGQVCEQTIKYVVEYEIAAKRRSRFESPSKNIAANVSAETAKKSYGKVLKNQPANTVEVEATATADEQAMGLSARATSPNAGDDAPVSMTYTVEYAVQTNKYGKGKVSKPEYHVEVTHELDRREQEITEAVEPDPTSIDVDVVAAQNVGSMAVEEVPKPRVALESLPVETMTYSVQYEISRKIRKTKTRSTSRQLGVDSSVSLVSTAQPTAVVAGTVDLSISNTDVGAKTNEPDNISSVISTPFVEIVATPVIAASVPDTTVESVSYVVQYEIVRKKKTAPSKQNTTYVAVSENNKATASNTVLKSVNTGEITLIQKSAEVVPQPEYNDIRVSGSSTIVGDSDAAVETKTYIVDYDIQVDRKTKRNKRGMETDDDDHQLVLDDIPLPPDNHDITADDLDLIESQTTVSPNDIISRVVQYDIIQQHLDDVTEQHLDSSSPRTHEMNVQIELGSQRFDAPEGFIIDVGINHEEVPHSEVDAPATHAAPTSVEYGVEYKISEVIDSKDLRFSGDETRSDYQFSPRSYIPEFELKATGEHVDEGSQLAMPEVSSKPVSFTVNSDISQEAGRSRQEAHDIILTSNDEGFNFTQHQVTSQPSSPSYSESLYLQILRIAAESADNGHRNGRTKSDSQPMKVTYITSHPIPSRNGDGKPKVQLGEDQPQINLSTITEERSGDMSEDMPRLQDSDVNLHETSRPKVCEYEVEVEINVDSVHRPSSLDVEHNQTINSSVHTNNQASFDANHETMGIKHTNDLWLTGENSDQSLPLGDIDQNAPAPGSRIGKVNNKKLFELRGGKIKKTTQTPEVETELETITFIVNYDINELLEDQRHKNYILTGKKRGQKYEVGRKEANIVSDEKIKTELPRDEEDELFDATMRMIIESTGRGSEPPITTPEVHLVPDVQVEAAILEFDRLLPDVSVPTASSVYSTKMPLTASMCENEVVADISINEQYTEQRHSPSNRAEDRIVTSLAQPERQGGHQYQYKSSDDDDVTSDSTTVVMNGKTLNWTTSGNHKENTIYIGPTSTQTSGYSERVMYSDWTAENENGYLTRDVEVSPTSTILSGSPDFSESRVTELKTSATILRPPTVLIDCQDSGIEQEASSPTFSGTSSEFEAGTRSTSSARTMGVGMASRTEVVPEKSVNLNTSSSGNRLRRYAVPMQPVENFKNEWSRTTPLGTKSSHRVDPLPVPTDDQHFVVVAIDFGTTFSGYAFSFTSATGKPMTSGSATPTNDGHGGTTSSHPEVNTVHVMRRWEGGDPGVINYKAPTTLLLNPVGEFHSFGFSARDFYHDLSSRQAKTWMYFEKFKMTLHSDAKLNVDSKLTASNGQQVSALKVFSTALAFFRSHALQEISDQSGTPIVAGDVKWIVTVPSIWRDPAKEFMRTAAYQAGIASADNPKQLVIALEPEVASLYVRRLHLHQLVPDTALLQRPWTTRSRASVSPERNRASITATFAPSIGEMIITTSSGTNRDSIMTSQTTISPSRWSFNRNDVVPVYSELTVGDQTDTPGMRYMIVDCGGGTVDITVHELDRKSNTPGELHKSTTGGPFGSIGVDMAFETLLVDIFGADFVNAFKAKRPAGWVDLMMAFESRKRAAHPMKTKTLNVPLPFSFIDYHKKHRSFPVEVAVRRYGNRDVSWSSQGMLRLAPRAMRHLFQATLDGIKQAIARVLNNPDVRGVQFMFLVGGFSESPMLQLDIRNEFKHLVKIIIPVEVSLAILKGAVYFGINISTATVRYSRMTYAVNVVRPFIAGIDSTDKLIYLEGADWCADAVDVFVFAGQPLRIGETVARRYCPTSSSWITSSLLAGQQAAAMFDIYRSGDCADIRYVTDRGLVKCGSVNLDINSSPVADIRIQMTFWENEILVVAMDDESGNTASIKIDFLSERTRSNVDD